VQWPFALIERALNRYLSQGIFEVVSLSPRGAGLLAPVTRFGHSCCREQGAEHPKRVLLSPKKDPKRTSRLPPSIPAPFAQHPGTPEPPGTPPQPPPDPTTPRPYEEPPRPIPIPRQDEPPEVDDPPPRRNA
jgi:hypothetical protein